MNFLKSIASKITKDTMEAQLNILLKIADSGMATQQEGLNFLEAFHMMFSFHPGCQLSEFEILKFTVNQISSPLWAQFVLASTQNWGFSQYYNVKGDKNAISHFVILMLQEGTFPDFLQALSNTQYYAKEHQLFNEQLLSKSGKCYPLPNPRNPNPILEFATACKWSTDPQIDNLVNKIYNLYQSNFQTVFKQIKQLKPTQSSNKKKYPLSISENDLDYFNSIVFDSSAFQQENVDKQIIRQLLKSSGACKLLFGVPIGLYEQLIEFQSVDIYESSNLWQCAQDLLFTDVHQIAFTVHQKLCNYFKFLMSEWPQLFVMQLQNLVYEYIDSKSNYLQFGLQLFCKQIFNCSIEQLPTAPLQIPDQLKLYEAVIFKTFERLAKQFQSSSAPQFEIMGTIRLYCKLSFELDTCTNQFANNAKNVLDLKYFKQTVQFCSQIVEQQSHKLQLTDLTMKLKPIQLILSCDSDPVVKIRDKLMVQQALSQEEFDLLYKFIGYALRQSGDSLSIIKKFAAADEGLQKLLDVSSSVEIFIQKVLLENQFKAFIKQLIMNEEYLQQNYEACSDIFYIAEQFLGIEGEVNVKHNDNNQRSVAQLIQSIKKASNYDEITETLEALIRHKLLIAEDAYLKLLTKLGTALKDILAILSEKEQFKITYLIPYIIKYELIEELLQITQEQLPSSYGQDPALLDSFCILELKQQVYKFQSTPDNITTDEYYNTILNKFTDKTDSLSEEVFKLINMFSTSLQVDSQLINGLNQYVLAISNSPHNEKYLKYQNSQFTMQNMQQVSKILNVLNELYKNPLKSYYYASIPSCQMAFDKNALTIILSCLSGQLVVPYCGYYNIRNIVKQKFKETQFGNILNSFEQIDIYQYKIQPVISRMLSLQQKLRQYLFNSITNPNCTHLIYLRSSIKYTINEFITNQEQIYELMFIIEILSAVFKLNQPELIQQFKQYQKTIQLEENLQFYFILQLLKQKQAHTIVQHIPFLGRYIQRLQDYITINIPENDNLLEYIEYVQKCRLFSSIMNIQRIVLESSSEFDDLNNNISFNNLCQTVFNHTNIEIKPRIFRKASITEPFSIIQNNQKQIDGESMDEIVNNIQYLLETGCELSTWVMIEQYLCKDQQFNQCMQNSKQFVNDTDKVNAFIRLMFILRQYDCFIEQIEKQRSYLEYLYDYDAPILSIQFIKGQLDEVSLSAAAKKLHPTLQYSLDLQMELSDTKELEEDILDDETHVQVVSLEQIQTTLDQNIIDINSGYNRNVNVDLQIDVQQGEYSEEENQSAQVSDHENTITTSNNYPVSNQQSGITISGNLQQGQQEQPLQQVNNQENQNDNEESIESSESDYNFEVTVHSQIPSINTIPTAATIVAQQPEEEHPIDYKVPSFLKSDKKFKSTHSNELDNYQYLSQTQSCISLIAEIENKFDLKPEFIFDTLEAEMTQERDNFKKPVILRPLTEKSYPITLALQANYQSYGQKNKNQIKPVMLQYKDTMGYICQNCKRDVNSLTNPVTVNRCWVFNQFLCEQCAVKFYNLQFVTDIGIQEVKVSQMGYELFCASYHFPQYEMPELGRIGKNQQNAEYVGLLRQFMDLVMGCGSLKLISQRTQFIDDEIFLTSQKITAEMIAMLMVDVDYGHISYLYEFMDKAKIKLSKPKTALQELINATCQPLNIQMNNKLMSHVTIKLQQVCKFLLLHIDQCHFCQESIKTCIGCRAKTGLGNLQQIYSVAGSQAQLRYCPACNKKQGKK
ncbi:Conserved_hypothetical protein [Hexamita inflata]|uniref:Uncharacterized protein n=1 Tax=Hexamita inflata TaxID=28002 RepID=A0AA86RGB7_9EUKA|nr:Conserved hypothetical protein [Hexamita inflata]